MAWTIVVVSMGLMVLGGHMFVAGAAAFGKRLGVSPVIIGGTVIAIGTSLPEWALSVDAALQGKTDISAGNVIGSNVFNLCFVLGLAALITTIPASKIEVRRDGGTMLAACVLLVVACADGIVSPTEGALLLAAAVVTLVVAIVTGRDKVDAEETRCPPPWRWWHLPQAATGLGIVLAGAHAFISAAEQIAVQMGMSQWVVGLAIAATGTSLPELVTSLACIWQKRPGMVLGNVLGSNTMNIVFVLGSAASVRALTSPYLVWITTTSFLAIMVLGITFLATGGRLGRAEGGLLVLAGVGWYALELSM